MAALSDRVYRARPTRSATEGPVVSVDLPIGRRQASPFHFFRVAALKFQLSVKKSSNNFRVFQKISICFPESGLINGLQANGGKKINDEAVDGVACRRRAVCPFSLASFQDDPPILVKASEGLAPF